MGSFLGELGSFLGEHLVQLHHLRVAGFDDGIEFVLVVHLLAHFGVHRGEAQATEDIHHFGVVFIVVHIETDNLLIARIPLRLVEYAQHLVEPIVYLAVQERYLHDYAVVDQTVDEGVLHSVFHHPAVVVVCVMRYIDHILVDIPHTMTQQIYGYHRHGISVQSALLHHVLLGIVLCSEITAEAQGLRIEPRLLQLDEYKPHGSVVFLHSCGEVDAEHGNLVTRHVRMLMTAHLHAHHLFLEQGGEHGFGYAFVFHQELEH